MASATHGEGVPQAESSRWNLDIRKKLRGNSSAKVPSLLAVPFGDETILSLCSPDLARKVVLRFLFVLEDLAKDPVVARMQCGSSDYGICH
jgi:hypothetical protein